MLWGLLLAGCATAPPPRTQDEADEQEIERHRVAAVFCGFGNTESPGASEVCLARHQASIDSIETRRLVRQQSELAREQDERHHQDLMAATAPPQPTGPRWWCWAGRTDIIDVGQCFDTSMMCAVQSQDFVSRFPYPITLKHECAAQSAAWCFDFSDGAASTTICHPVAPHCDSSRVAVEARGWAASTCREVQRG